jgi:serine/threonine protein kinase
MSCSSEFDSCWILACFVAGCIFGELLRHRPLLPGKTESHQLSLICHLLGTPHEKIWPGFTELVKHAAEGVSLPAQPYNNLSHEFPNLGEAGLDLLSRLLTYDPSKRITSEKALAHPYFSQAPLPCPENLMPTFGPPPTPVRHVNGQQQPQSMPLSAAPAVPPASNLLPPLQQQQGGSRKRKPEEELLTAASEADPAAAAQETSGKRTKKEE